MLRHGPKADAIRDSTEQGRAREGGSSGRRGVGGGRVAARPEQRSSSRTGPRLTTAAQAACLLLGSG